jgi:hypothetical protein
VNLMSIRTFTAALVGAALFGLAATAAFAQTVAPGTAPPATDAQAAPAKPQPNANTAGAPAVTVTITNLRKADLVWLLAAEARLCKLDNCARRPESRQKGVD